MVVRDSILRRKFVRLLAAAAILHLLLVVSIYLVGRFGLWPKIFDANGIGLAFAADCLGYRTEAVKLTETLMRQGVAPWLTAPSEYLVNPFHVKIYSLSFLVAGPLLGYNILAAEPLNLTYYLIILCLVFMLGREVFDERTGILSACAVALWPSLLLHTTQLFREPLFIACVFGLMLLCARSLTRDYSWTKGLKDAALGSSLIVLLWLVRREMWEVVLAILLLTTVLLLIRQLGENRILCGSLLSVALLLIVNLTLPCVWRAVEQGGGPQPQNSEAAARAQSEIAQERQNLLPGSGLYARILQLRRGFELAYPNAGSNIDAGVEFNSLSDVILYIPRAASIGFFAPFPNMWFTAGTQAGLKGRLLTGLETSLMYIIALFAFAAFWHHRRELSVWLLLLASGAGLTALGFVVVNIGTLYRMRYSYWMMLVVLGAEGFRRVVCKADEGVHPPVRCKNSSSESP